MSGIAQLRIGPYIYRVEYVDGLRADDDTRLAGNIEYERAVISIDRNSIEAVQLVTLFHEVIHGILANAGIAHHKERLIDAIATGLVQVLIDNPALAEEFVHTECDCEHQHPGNPYGLRTVLCTDNEGHPVYLEPCTESDVLKKLGDVGLAK